MEVSPTLREAIGSLLNQTLELTGPPVPSGGGVLGVLSVLFGSSRKYDYLSAALGAWLTWSVGFSTHGVPQVAVANILVGVVRLLASRFTLFINLPVVARRCVAATSALFRLLQRCSPQARLLR